jgi:hypothetical protein
MERLKFYNEDEVIFTDERRRNDEEKREFLNNLINQTKKINPKISYFVDTRERNDKKELLTDVYKFIKNITQDFNNEFACLIKEYFNKRTIKSKRIENYLDKYENRIPSFLVYDFEEGLKWLEKNKLVNDVSEHMFNEEDVMVIINLPKPMAQWWWKGGDESWGNLGQKVDNTVIEWGHFYRECMDSIWNNINELAEEKHVEMYRLNDVGQHNPSEYYYIWSISSNIKKGNPYVLDDQIIKKRLQYYRDKERKIKRIEFNKNNKDKDRYGNIKRGKIINFKTKRNKN